MSHVRPQTSLLLFTKPVNTPLLWDFDKPVGPEGFGELKNCIKPKLNISGSHQSFVLFPIFI